MSTHTHTTIRLLIVFAVFIVGYGFSVSDKLPWMSDDSATYLIMAEVLSPYSGELNPPFFKSYSEFRSLPPGFPFLLSFINVYENISAVHLVVLIQFSLAVFFWALFARKITNGEAYSYIFIIIFLSLPGVWIELLKINSENQYLLLTAIFFLLPGFSTRGKNSYAVVIYGVLMSTIILTRTIGLSLFAAWILGSIKHTNTLKHKLKSSIIFIALSITPLLLWKTLSSAAEGNYIHDLLLPIHSDNPIEALSVLFISNASEVYSAWISIGINEWLPRTSIQAIAFSIFLIFFIVGLFSRARSIDGTYFILYMSILLIWPYPEDMKRFLYPITPLIIIYMLLGIDIAGKKLVLERKIVWAISISILLLTLPNLYQLAHRYTITKKKDGDISQAPIIYTNKNLDNMIRIDQISSKYEILFSELKHFLNENSTLLTLKPQAITYFSGIYAERLPVYRQPEERSLFIKNILTSNASHLLITHLTYKTNPLGVDAEEAVKEVAKNIIEYRDASNGKLAYGLYEIQTQ